MVKQSAAEIHAYAMAFERAPIGQALVTVDGCFLSANPALHTLLEWPAGQLLGRSVSDVLDRDEVEAYRVMVGRLGEDGPATVRREQRYRTTSGTLVIAAQSVTLIDAPDGGPHRVLLQLEDRTAATEQARLLARERDRLRQAQVVGRLGLWERDVATGEVTWSDALFELRGLDRNKLGTDISAATSMVHPQDRDQVREAIEEGSRTGREMSVRYRASRVDDLRERWFESRFKGLYDGGELVTLAGTVVDVTEDVLAEEKIQSAYAMQQAIIKASPDITFLFDLATERTVWSSRHVREALGYPVDDQDPGDALSLDLVPEADRSTVQAARQTAFAAADDDVVSVSFRLLDASGGMRWFSCRTTPLDRADDGAVAQVVGVLRDITEATAVEQRLQHLALHDDLTGLANRALLIDRIQGALLRSTRDAREVSVLYLDLDGFKRINDTAGHAAGDAVLIETARRLESVVREGDTVARVGGDEFVLVVEPWNRPEMVWGPPGGRLDSDRELGPQIADRVTNALHRPIEYHGVEFVVSASIGVTYGPMGLTTIPNEITADGVLQDADAAMYTAKQRGKDRFEVFEHGMRTDVVERGRVEWVLRRALDSGQARAAGSERSADAQPDRIWAVYEPIFSARTGALTGLEARARLADGGGIPVRPDLFLPVAEETGQIRAFGAFMLDQAVGQLASWRRRWPEFSAVTMAVNVSALQVGHASMVDDVRSAVAAHGLQPQDLVLEVTETALLQAGRSTIAALQELRTDGMGVHIDDFGVGNASLRYLATMPVSGVKIDKSFTAGLPDDKVSRKIVSAIAALAADLQITCTVEGVETAAQLAALPHGVRVQGGHTGSPLDPGDFDLPALTRGRSRVPDAAGATSSN